MSEKIFECSRLNGKTTSMVLDLLGFMQSNKGVGAYVIITIDEFKQLQTQQTRAERYEKALREIASEDESGLTFPFRYLQDLAKQALESEGSDEG